MKEKIVLGTVQLGIPYGINNATGKPSEAEAFQILDFAYEHDIKTLDSADAYGEALRVIGRHKTATGKSFKVINKFKADPEPLLSKLKNSLEVIGCDSMFCYMYHHFIDYETGNCRKELIDLKSKGLFKKLGISLYETNQLKKVIKDPEIDVIQLPVNVLDLNAEKRDLLRLAKQQGKEIHARSIYLQGLLLKDTKNYTGNLKALKTYVDKLAIISTAHKIDLKMAALNFVLQQEYIDHVILGIEHLNQLKENLALVNPAFNFLIFEGIEVQKAEAHLLNPVNWRP